MRQAPRGEIRERGEKATLKTKKEQAQPKKGKMWKKWQEKNIAKSTESIWDY